MGDQGEIGPSGPKVIFTLHAFFVTFKRLYLFKGTKQDIILSLQILF